MSKGSVGGGLQVLFTNQILNIQTTGLGECKGSFGQLFQHNPEKPLFCMEKKSFLAEVLLPGTDLGLEETFINYLC